MRCSRIAFSAFGEKNLLRQPDDDGSPTREFRVWDFGEESKIEIVREAGVSGGVIEEINDVCAEAVFEAAAFLEIEGAGGIDFDLILLFEESSEDALE